MEINHLKKFYQFIRIGRILKIEYTYFALLLLFISSPSFAQRKGGKAIYSITIQSDSILKKTLRPQIRDRYERAEKEIANLFLELVFDDTLSVFKNYQNKNISDVTEFALKLADCEKIIYTNLNNNEIIFNNAEKKAIFKKNEFLIQKKIENNWTFVNESKYIQNFKCYKATQQISIVNDEGTFFKTITAWYCPEIPFTFGPKGYCDLPGLIVELQDRNIVFGLKEISFFDKSIKIELPTKGVKVEYNEYLQILKERVMKRMELTEK
ncbi:GLPGLI family protein [Flavobacterium dankookense]|uniref:GLPGLI family protein n=1 Tax=Flavobacterium dankookense TaxID=706186 RepID=A0A4R6QG44_9FLAO|nr:GLPGLI family protein [Flavobacterium dankookense]TDP61940.1 GLPGLI family protein [Flavobacterium dankookense]